MSRVITKVKDLESLKKAKLELQQHIELKKINIKVETDSLKYGLLQKSEASQESLKGLLNDGVLNKSLVKLIVYKFIKPKSKILGKASVFLGSFLIDKYA